MVNRDRKGEGPGMVGKGPEIGKKKEQRNVEKMTRKGRKSVRGS